MTDALLTVVAPAQGLVGMASSFLAIFYSPFALSVDFVFNGVQRLQRGLLQVFAALDTLRADNASATVGVFAAVVIFLRRHHDNEDADFGEAVERRVASQAPPRLARTCPLEPPIDRFRPFVGVLIPP